MWILPQIGFLYGKNLKFINGFFKMHINKRKIYKTNVYMKKTIMLLYDWIHIAYTRYKA